MWSLDPAKCALLVVDMQNDFVLEGYPMEVPNARKAIPVSYTHLTLPTTPYV